MNLPRPQKGQRFGGRKKGTPNKLTATVKEAFELAFSELQRDKRYNLKQWARENSVEFYKLCAKLIPTQLTGEGGGPLQVAGVVSVYMPDNGRRNDAPVLAPPTKTQPASITTRKRLNKALH